MIQPWRGSPTQVLLLAMCVACESNDRRLLAQATLRSIRDDHTVHGGHLARSIPCTGLLLRDSMKSLYSGNHMVGCQNYGPFLGPYYNTAPNI